MKNKEGQVTLFIILGVVLVVGIGTLAYVTIKNSADTVTPESLGPQTYIQTCVEEAVGESIEKILENGGTINPTFTKTYGNEEWNYLCYAYNNYDKCYNTFPTIEQIEGEIALDTQEIVMSCFDTVRKDYVSRGYNVEGDTTYYSIDLLPGQVKVNLENRITISDAETSQTIEDFGFNVITPLYELLDVASEIVNAESYSCSFEANGYMVLQPQYDIILNKVAGNKFYQVIDRYTDTEFKFVVRSCAKI